MKSNFIRAAVLSVAALTGVAASAQTFNSYLFDQMSAPATKTRAEVKAEALQAQREGALAGAGDNGAVARQSLSAPRADKTGASPQAAADLGKPSQH